MVVPVPMPIPAPLPVAPVVANTKPKHIVVTPENIAWDQAPPSLPPGAQVMILDGDPAAPGLFAMRVKFPSNYRIPPHWHPADEHVTVLSGTLHVAMGDQFDTTQGDALHAGAYAVMPAHEHHYAWTAEEAVVQLHGIGPWQINYLNGSDDPRNQTHSSSVSHSIDASVSVEQPAQAPTAATSKAARKRKP